jgi:hypothetical protein
MQDLPVDDVRFALEVKCGVGASQVLLADGQQFHAEPMTGGSVEIVVHQRQGAGSQRSVELGHPGEELAVFLRDHQRSQPDRDLVAADDAEPS